MHIVWSGHSGGAERLIKDIHVYSDHKRFDHQICFLAKGGMLKQALEEKGVTVYCLGMKNGFSIIKGCRLNGILHTADPDIIHNHCRNFLASFFVVNKRRAAKIYFEHGGDLIGTRPKREILLYFLFARFYGLILANSEYVKQRILRMKIVEPRRIRTFYIGIDPEHNKDCRSTSAVKQYLDLDKGKRIVGIVCRLVEQKGVDDFIKTAYEIQKMRKDILFLVVGEGKHKKMLEKMAIDLGVNIRFLGDRKDIPAILRAFDIFLFTSKWEPFGIVLLEAMAAQKPILGFKVGGAQEIVDRGGGILLGQRDHRELAELVIKVLHDRALYKRLAAQGYSNIVNNFHIKNSIRRLENEYIMLVS
jgi:glycosyltransferase involved in cell wall biosynthesis